MALTQLKIQNAKPKEKPYKLGDSGGLYMLVTPQGSRLWRFRYVYLGKQKDLALGQYPDLSLTEAREKRDEARRIKAKDIDPLAYKQEQRRIAIQKDRTTFEGIAYAYLSKLSKRRSIMQESDTDSEDDGDQTTVHNRSKDLADSYRHLREHGNTAFIFLLEIALCPIIFVALTREGDKAFVYLAALLVIWITPSVFTHWFGQHLERRWPLLAAMPTLWSIFRLAAMPSNAIIPQTTPNRFMPCKTRCSTVSHRNMHSWGLTSNSREP